MQMRSQSSVASNKRKQRMRLTLPQQLYSMTQDTDCVNVFLTVPRPHASSYMHRCYFISENKAFTALIIMRLTELCSHLLYWI
jgi:hypothetical protein